MSPLSHRLQSLVPFWGASDDTTVAIRALRLGLVFVSLFVPLYGWAYHLTVPEAYDPVWARVVLSVAALILLIGSYVVSSIRDQPRPWLVGLTVVLLSWYGYLTWANALDPGYAMGYTFLIVSVALAYSIVWNRPEPFSIILMVAFAISVVVALAVRAEDAHLSRWLFLLSIASCEIAVFFAFSGRLVIGRDLRRSQARLSAAERLAGTGTWSTHLPTGRRTWSKGLYEILGVDPGQDAPPSPREFVIPEDQDLVERLNEKLFEEGTTGTQRFRVMRPDGEVRWLQTAVELTRDATGRPRSLHGVSQDVTEQMAREAELAKARDEAEAAAAAQSSFLANMSHEIRTPLTAIIGFAQMLRMEAGPELQDLAEPIQTGGERLLNTLNSVLDLAKMDSGETHLTLAPTDVVTAIAGLAGPYQKEAEEKGLVFSADLPSELLLALADPEALKRVVENLLSNAVTYTVSGYVQIAVRRTATHAEIGVFDSGIGMDVSFVEQQLFQPFQQASEGWDRTYEGTGLGLTISHRLVEAMNGSIQVESEKGAGSRFVVALPLAATGDGMALPADEISVLEPAVG
ncbi:MAG: ATP-binding protein [Bacteroidota bacterium]